MNASEEILTSPDTPKPVPDPSGHQSQLSQPETKPVKYKLTSSHTGKGLWRDAHSYYSWLERLSAVARGIK